MDNDTKEFDFLKQYETAQIRLLKIWGDIGLAETCKQERKIVFSKHLEKLVEEIVKEEEEYLDELKKGITEKQEELNKLCGQLEVPSYQPDHDLKLMSIDTDLTDKLAYLRNEKAKRVSKMAELLQQDGELCCLLNTPPCYLASDTTPTHQQLSNLESHIKMLTKQKRERERQFKDSKDKIKCTLDLLDISPASQFEKDVLSQTTESFVPNDHNMTLLQEFHDRLEKRLNENRGKSEELRGLLGQLWEDLKTPQQHQDTFLNNNTALKQECIVALQEEVNRCKVVKLQDAKKELILLKTKLEKIWVKCYIGAEEIRAFKAHHQGASIGDSVLLQILKAEFNRMRDYFIEREALINKVTKYNDIWEQFLVFENKSSIPSRLFDKGWSLLREEAERNKIFKELPKLEFEIEEQILEWKSETGLEFRVMGKEFVEWVKARWNDLKEKKENKKTMRQQARQRQMEQESIYGTKADSITPIKRNYSPAKNSASKSRRVLQPCYNNNNTPQKHPKQPTLNYNPQETSTSFLLSDTIVSAHQIQQQESNQTMVLDKYNEFEIMLNEEVRYKARSSMMPQNEEQE